MSMCIVHVLSSFGMGGQERVAFDLAVGQREAGHDAVAVSLAPDDEGPLGEEFRRAGVDIVHLPKRSGFDVRLPWELGQLFRRRGATVVHTHNPQPLIYGGAPAKLAGAALVHTKHGVNPDNGRRVWMRKAAGRLTDAFVAVSEPTAAVARSEKECDGDKLRVIPNGIDLTRFGRDPEDRAAIRRDLGIPAQAWVVGTVGRLWPEKGHPFLLRAIEPLLGRDFHLIIAGDGPEAGGLARAVSALSTPGSVHLLGARKDIPRVIAAFDTFVLSSVREGLPLVIPEAMAAGLPVVSTAVGGIPQVVADGETGYLVAYDDDAALRDRLEYLSDDPERARSLGRRGREVALARYSCRRMVDDYLTLYREVARS
jgi:glycosyltransferase involved in cell wall biosynthesis